MYLVGEEALYQGKSYAEFVSNCASSKKQGCPKDGHLASAFDKFYKHFEDSEECHFTLHNQVKRIEEMTPESSSVTKKALKLKLLKKNGDGVTFAQMKKKDQLLFAVLAPGRIDRHLVLTAKG